MSRLHENFPGVPVVPVLGNHDSAPKDFFPDSTNKSTPAKAYSSKNVFLLLKNINVFVNRRGYSLNNPDLSWIKRWTSLLWPKAVEARRIK